MGPERRNHIRNVEIPEIIDPVGVDSPWSFNICRALYLRIPRPSLPWGREWIASGAFISRCEKGAPRSACRGGEGVHRRGSYPNASGSDRAASDISCANNSGASSTLPFENRSPTYPIFFGV